MKILLIGISILFISGITGPVRKPPSPELIIDELPARIIDLEQTALYSNNSDITIPQMQHHVTIPPGDHDYQILLSTSISGAEKYQIVRHRNYINSYLRLTFPLPAASSVTIKIRYRLLIIPVDYNRMKAADTPSEYPEDFDLYLNPSHHIESDAAPLREIARSFKSETESPHELARKSYEFPARHLRFKPQPRSIGALAAYEGKTGDCTEYSSLFCALSRASGVPARRYSVFSMGKHLERTWSMPNHTAAEVYLTALGWIPVDPNLSYGKYDNKHSFGKTADNIIYFNREGAWVWGRHYPGNVPDKKLVTTKVSWNGKVIESGIAESLYNKYYLSP